jgi:hypothetical protein
VTLEAWVNPTSLADWRCVMLKERGTGGLAYSLYASDGANRPPSGYIYRARDVAAVGVSTLALNTWSHLAATYDGANLRLYVNGALAATTAITGNIAATANPLRIGGNAVWGEYFSGLIDEVRVYNRALTQAEVQTDMNTAVVAPPAAAAAMLMAAPTSPAGAARISSGGDAAQGVTQSVLSPDDAGTGALTGRRIALRRLLRLADPGAVRAIAARRGH